MEAISEFFSGTGFALLFQGGKLEDADNDSRSVLSSVSCHCQKI